MCFMIVCSRGYDCTVQIGAQIQILTRFANMVRVKSKSERTAIFVKMQVELRFCENASGPAIL